jgi:choline dehydrogenase-like flavoprotein
MNARQYDVIVVGSGAGGGIAAYVLTHRGLNVLLLEAGRDYEPARETPMFQVEADAPLNGASTPDRPNGFYDAGLYFGGDIPGEPYTVAEGARYKWQRTRILGGRTNHWGRLSYRYGPHDFRTYSRDGVGVDWPISYQDLAPYYDRVEKLIGVFGDAEEIENSPDSPPGVLLPPPPMRVGELWMKMAVEKQLGIRVVPNHAAILTQPLNGRAPCLYATACGRGCSIGANFQTPTVLLPPARATRRLEIRTLAMVYEVVLDKRGRASGVHYVDKATNTRLFARGRAVVLAASTGETARLLFNSKSAIFPNGLANSSGQVGRNLTESVMVGVSGNIPVLQGLQPYNDDGVSAPHALVPWWGHRDKNAGRLAFATDYIVFAGATRSMPAVGFAELPEERGKPIYGRALRDRLRYEYGSKFRLATCGGMIPNDACRCELDPSVRDRWGIPVLRFHWKWGEQERAQAKHSAETLRDMVLAMGGTNLSMSTERTEGGVMWSGHELGTARMGANAANSVLNAFGHTWDVRNLYITDGSVFSGHAGKNPTETIMALAWRASDHLADSLIRKEI